MLSEQVFTLIEIPKQNFISSFLNKTRIFNILTVFLLVLIIIGFPFFLTQPMVSADFFPEVELISPQPSSVYTSSVSIQWIASDPYDLQLEIFMYYRSESNDSWIRISTDSLNNSGSFNWDCSHLPDGHYYLMIEAVNSQNYIGHDSSELFTIDNDNSALDISDVEITNDQGIDKEYIRNDDNLVITATIQHGQDLTENDIFADLSELGKKDSVHPDNYDGTKAEWNISHINCENENGEIVITINVDNIEQKNVELTADNTPPEISITSPQNGFYVLDNKLLPKDNLVVIGPCQLDITVDENVAIDEVQIYIDDELFKSLNSEPYEIYLNTRLIGNHNIKVNINDKVGFSDSAEINGFFFIL